MKADTGHAGEGEATGGDNEDRDDEDVIKMSRIPDGGWGWMVALGTLIVNILNTNQAMMFSMHFGFGILYSGYLLSAGISGATTAWIYNMFLVTCSISMALCNALRQEFGRRTVGFISVIICSLSIILSAFSPSAYYLCFSYSFMGGASVGLVLFISFTALPPYFDKNRGKANTFIAVGPAVSQMAFAPLLRYLLELYSYRGAALVYSGILLNSLIGVLFFHPVKWHLKPLSGDAPRQEQHAMQALMSQGEDLSPAAANTAEGPHVDSTLQVPPSAPVSRSLQSLRRSIYGSVVYIMSAASADVSQSDLPVEKEESTGPTQSRRAAVLWRTLGRIAATTKSDLMVVQHFRAVILVSTFMITQSTLMNFMMVLPFVIRTAGHTLQDAAWCISLVGVSNLVIRLVLSPLADWKRFSIRGSLMAGYFLKAVAVTVTSLASELWLFSSAAVVFGVGIAASVTMLTLSIVEYMGMEMLAQTFGAMCLMSSLAFIIIGPLLGVIRDVTNSYTVSLWMLAALDLVSVGLWLLMPAAQARDARRKHTRDDGASQISNINTDTV